MSSLEERVSRLEGGYEHLATKADVEGVRVEVADVRGEVADLRGEVRALKWAVTAGFIGLGALMAILRYLG